MAASGGGPGGPGGCDCNPNISVQMGATGRIAAIKLANIYALCDVNSDYAGPEPRNS